MFHGKRFHEPTATNLIDLHAELEDDESFAHLRTEGNRLVPGIGSSEPEVFILYSAPGAVEISNGVALSGDAGAVLKDLMDSAGLWVEPQWSNGSEDHPETIGEVEPNAWATYTLKYRPPGRKPTIGEVLRMQPYIRREWAIMGRPKVMVAVGAVAWQAIGPILMGGVMSWAGQPMLLRDNKTWLWPMLPPEYGMINEDARPTLERHWAHFGEWIDNEEYDR